MSISIQTRASNFAYDDGFIWYIAGRLSSETGMRLNFGQLEPADRHQFLGDLSLIYHHRLIACDGPLSEIAEKFRYFDNEKLTVSSTLSYIGQADYEYWPVVRKWEASIRDEVTQLFSSGRFTTAPPGCLAPDYHGPWNAKP